MSSTDTLYTARFLIPEWIERRRDNLLKCRVYRGGALVAPTSGTVSLYDASGTAVVNGASVTVTDSVAQYTVAQATVASEDFGDGWWIEWTLLMADGVAHLFRNAAALVRRRLYPPATDADLIRRHSDLSDLRPSSLTSYQDYLDEAWASIETRLIAEGTRPQLVMSPAAFRDVHLFKTLELVFVDFHQSTGAGKFRDLADYYGREYGRAWGRLNFVYDGDDDGEPDAAYRRRAAAASIWTNGRGW